MQWLKIPLRIQHLNELTLSVWLIVYESLFQTSLDQDRPEWTTIENQRNHMATILESLQQIIGMDLSHIRVEDLRSGDRVAIGHLLEILLELARVMVGGSSVSGGGGVGVKAISTSRISKEITDIDVMVDEIATATRQPSERLRPNPMRERGPIHVDREEQPVTESVAPSEASTAGRRKAALSRLVDDIPEYIKSVSGDGEGDERSTHRRSHQRRRSPQRRTSPRRSPQKKRPGKSVRFQASLSVSRMHL